MLPVPQALIGRLRLPVMAAPMFLVSGPELVVACCRAGVVGSFPALNARPAAELDRWLCATRDALACDGDRRPAPVAVNLIVHQSNGRLGEDLATIVRHRVPLVITSLGDPAAVVEAVHAYDGLVFHDVVMARHARKAMRAGVDGIIAVASGAGGHAGTQSVVSLVRELREIWDGCLVAAGAITDGFAVRAVEVLGADLAYVGTRFIATREAAADGAYKAMLVSGQVSDLVYTDRVSGVHGNFLAPSLAQAGAGEERTQSGDVPVAVQVAGEAEAVAWKTAWSAGHGLATIHDLPTVGELVARMADEYQRACRLPPSLGVNPVW